MRKHRRYGFVLVLAVAGGVAVQPVSANLSVAAAATGGDHTTHNTNSHHSQSSGPSSSSRHAARRSGGVDPAASASAGSPATTAPVRRRERAAARSYAAKARQEFFSAESFRRYVDAVERSRYVQAVEAQQAASAAAQRAVDGDWAALRRCESGGNYAEDSGNGYYGAYQFSLSTWEGLGYAGLPNEASPAVQDSAAQSLQARSGWGQWPACSAELGL